MADATGTGVSLVPVNSPFSYNVGINYESWQNGRSGYTIAGDLDAITQNFKLIKTYHDAAVGTADPTTPIIDPTQQDVITYVVAHPGVELAMGTNNNALASGGYGTPWSPGLMVDPAYTDKWVSMIIEAFGSTNAVEENLGMILLGNELDMNGPPPGDPSFAAYYDVWIPQAFLNLQASLAKFGLGSIAVSTTIANYGVSNVVSTSVSAFIESHWSAGWNGGTPIVMFNQYTPDYGASTQYDPVINYFQSLANTFNGGIAPFIGETGYSTYYGQANQAAVYKQIFDWVDGQWANGHKTVPLFAFDAFDQPTRMPDSEKQFGIFTDSAGTYGFKPGIEALLPSWLATPTNTQVQGTALAEREFAKPGHDMVDLGLGNDTFAYGGASARYSVALSGAVALVTDHATGSTDTLANVQVLEFADGERDLFATDQIEIAGLYLAQLGRAADSDGFAYWSGLSFRGGSIDELVNAFKSSGEYAGRNALLDDQAWLDALYDNVLDRQADAAGRLFWLEQVDKGATRADVELAFVQSQEFAVASQVVVDQSLWTTFV